VQFGGTPAYASPENFANVKAVITHVAFSNDLLVGYEICLGRINASFQLL
jgi:hypothetical protein